MLSLSVDFIVTSCLFQFLYVNSAFAPSPDEIIGNLHKV